MPYFTPFIDETGLHIPTYMDIRDELLNQMRSIFGEDIYLDNDSMDYQQISIFARKIYDTNCLAQLVYNNRTPQTAIGVGLDNDVVYANIKRKPATNSTLELTITGSAGTIISKGEASDGAHSWVLPPSVTIPENGLITVVATSKEEGNIQALPNTVNKVVTPVYGWYGVTNKVAAVPGTNIESDASLRGRFAMATRAPSSTVFESMWAAVESVPKVTRIMGYENDTGTTSTGTVPAGIPADLPPHSVTFVVEGGEDTDIATQIYSKKTPGCYTNGTTEIQLQSVLGNVTIIRFYRPTYVPVKVTVTIKKMLGYNESFATDITNNIAKYIAEMQLGESLYSTIVSSIAANSAGTIVSPPFVVTGVTLNGSSGSDVVVKFYEAIQATASDIEVVVT